MPTLEALELQGGNVIARVEPTGVVIQSTGSLDPLLGFDEVARLAEWLDDVILAAAIADEEAS
jgi:hypothetical protein